MIFWIGDRWIRANSSPHIGHGAIVSLSLLSAGASSLSRSSRPDGDDRPQGLRPVAIFKVPTHPTGVLIPAFRNRPAANDGQAIDEFTAAAWTPQGWSGRRWIRCHLRKRFQWLAHLGCGNLWSKAHTRAICALPGTLNREIPGVVQRLVPLQHRADCLVAGTVRDVLTRDRAAAVVRTGARQRGQAMDSRKPGPNDLVVLKATYRISTRTSDGSSATAR